MLKIDLAALGEVRSHWRGIAVTVGVAWLVKPLSMAQPGWLFLGHLFRPLLAACEIDGYVAGLVMLAAAPCTAVERRSSWRSSGACCWQGVDRPR